MGSLNADLSTSIQFTIGPMVVNAMTPMTPTTSADPKCRIRCGSVISTASDFESSITSMSDEDFDRQFSDLLPEDGDKPMEDSPPPPFATGALLAPSQPPARVLSPRPSAPRKSLFPPPPRVKFMALSRATPSSYSTDENDAMETPARTSSRVLLFPPEPGSGNEWCSICSVSFNADDEVHTADCKHEYHLRCYEEFTRSSRSSSCPACESISEVVDSLSRLSSV